ncbi:MAG: hypothetical protein MJ142_06885, partial [Clostridia bacterium]|nr:hypothetical protein [Clostridia bacterium]
DAFRVNKMHTGPPFQVYVSPWEYYIIQISRAARLTGYERVLDKIIGNTALAIDKCLNDGMIINNKRKTKQEEWL